MTNRRRRLAAGIAGVCLASAALIADTRVYVNLAPPPLVVETKPVAPGPHHVWIGGYHRWDGRAYVWVPGHWALPPRPHNVWIAGHWKHAHKGWYWIDGHWR